MQLLDGKKTANDIKEEIDEFLDELFVMLELSKVVELRETYGEIEKKIEEVKLTQEAKEKCKAELKKLIYINQLNNKLLLVCLW